MAQGQRRDPEDCISHQELLELLHYDPSFGVFTWLKTPKAPVSRIKVGDIAGHRYEKYTVIRLKGKAYQAHQLAWFYVYKTWPEGLLDHRDTNGHNNRISNLREATKTTNGFNRSRDTKTTSGLKWVYPNRDKFMAKVTANGEEHYLGTFATKEEAYQVASNFAKFHHGEFYHG